MEKEALIIRRLFTDCFFYSFTTISLYTTHTGFPLLPITIGTGLAYTVSVSYHHLSTLIPVEGIFPNRILFYFNYDIKPFFGFRDNF
jgi:hypothetical protein